MRFPWQSRRPPERLVLLEKYDGRTSIAVAYPSDSGWIARWIGTDDAWSLLNPDGTTTGDKVIVRWYPHRGWQHEKKGMDSDG